MVINHIVVNRIVVNRIVNRLVNAPNETVLEMY